mgnify:CR=1 FL=1
MRGYRGAVNRKLLTPFLPDSYTLKLSSNALARISRTRKRSQLEYRHTPFASRLRHTGARLARVVRDCPFGSLGDRNLGFLQIVENLPVPGGQQRTVADSRLRSDGRLVQEVAQGSRRRVSCFPPPGRSRGPCLFFRGGRR